MHWDSIIFWIMAGVMVIAQQIARRHRLSPLFKRPCAGQAWRQTFPDVPVADIREFLKHFVDSFSLRHKNYLRFRPTDRIMDVYRAIYPPRWTVVDSLELETFVQLLQRRYGVASESITRDDLTLGDVFQLTRVPCRR